MHGRSFGVAESGWLCTVYTVWMSLLRLECYHIVNIIIASSIAFLVRSRPGLHLFAEADPRRAFLRNVMCSYLPEKSSRATTPFS